MFMLEPHIQALIFDCDGTLADTMPLHFLAWQETLKPIGGYFPERLFYELAGAPTDKITRILNDTFGYHLDPDKTVYEKENRFLTRVAQVKPIAPVAAIARHYQQQLPLAIASGGFRPVIQTILTTIGLADIFQVVVTTEDVARPKPAPDIFLEAARRLGVPPERCHVFEDADLGLEAAQKAGMSATDVRLLIRNGNLN